MVSPNKNLGFYRFDVVENYFYNGQKRYGKEHAGIPILHSPKTTMIEKIALFLLWRQQCRERYIIVYQLNKV